MRKVRRDAAGRGVRPQSGLTCRSRKLLAEVLQGIPQRGAGHFDEALQGTVQFEDEEDGRGDRASAHGQDDERHGIPWGEQAETDEEQDEPKDQDQQKRKRKLVCACSSNSQRICPRSDATCCACAKAWRWEAFCGGGISRSWS
jgi:hypothetical protein